MALFDQLREKMRAAAVPEMYGGFPPGGSGGNATRCEFHWPHGVGRPGNVGCRSGAAQSTARVHRYA
eukprot:8211519-Pyramimonas_sp.AAC.1